jgi:hypothetical protein
VRLSQLSLWPRERSCLGRRCEPRILVAEEKDDGLRETCVVQEAQVFAATLPCSRHETQVLVVNSSVACTPSQRGVKDSYQHASGRQEEECSDAAWTIGSLFGMTIACYRAERSPIFCDGLGLRSVKYKE